MLVEGLLRDTGWIVPLSKRLDLLSAREVLPDTSLSLKLLVALIEDSQSLPDLTVVDEVVAVHPERVILYLTVRVGQELERAITNGNSALEPALHLIVKQVLRYLLIVEILVLLLVDEHDSGEVVDLVAVLAQHMVRLLALERLNEEQSWCLYESVLEHQILSF